MHRLYIILQIKTNKRFIFSTKCKKCFVGDVSETVKFLPLRVIFLHTGKVKTSFFNVNHITLNADKARTGKEECICEYSHRYKN